MSKIRYGGVTIPYAFTTSFRQEAVYDELGGTDYYVTRFTIECQGILNTAYIAEICPDLVIQAGMDFTDNAGDLMNIIRKRLLKPRQDLSITVNGVELIPKITGLPGTVDSQNGPKPQHCTITPLTTKTFLLTYEIQAEYWECPNIQPSSTPIVQNSPGGPVLFNRWSERVEIDGRNFSTRVREGVFAIRSDNSEGKLADELRTQLAVVGVPNGFLRERSDYTVDPSGLRISYRTVDREVYLLPPFPAYEAEGEYIETSTRMGNTPSRVGEVRVRLKADRITNRARLLETAIQVAGSKLVNREFANGAFLGTLQQAVVKMELYDNDVECRMRALLNPQSDPTGKGRKEQTWGFRLDRIAETPYPNGPNQPLYFPRGEISILLQAAAYHDPCLQAQLSCETGQMTNGLAPGKAGVTRETQGATTGGTPFGADNPSTCTQQIGGIVTISTGVINPDDFAAKYQSLSPDRSIFLEYRVENRFESDKHIYMLPVAAAAGTPTFTAGGGTAAFCQLAAPTLLLISDWTALKSLERPQIPTPAIGSRWILLDEHHEPAMVILGADGVTPVYRQSGTYVFGCLDPSPLTIQDIAFGQPPWLIADGDVPRTVDPSQLFDGLILPF